MAILLIPGRVIFEMLRPGRVCWIEKDPLPEGAQVVGDEFDILRGVWKFLVEHESFDPVPEGALPPELPWMTIHVEQRAEVAP